MPVFYVPPYFTVKGINPYFPVTRGLRGGLNEHMHVSSNHCLRHSCIVFEWSLTSTVSPTDEFLMWQVDQPAVQWQVLVRQEGGRVCVPGCRLQGWSWSKQRRNNKHLRHVLISMFQRSLHYICIIATSPYRWIFVKLCTTFLTPRNSKSQ